MKTKPTFYECGICGHWHNAMWDGDCREDNARFFSDQLDAKYGPLGWTVIEMDAIDAWRRGLAVFQ